MKNILLFVLLFISASTNAQEIKYESQNGDLVLYEITGEEPCLARKNLEVFQASGTTALVCEVNDYSCFISGKRMMLLWDEHHYYDGEIIQNPIGKCAKQIGVYRYQTIAKYNNGMPKYKTVPIVSILDK